MRQLWTKSGRARLRSAREVKLRELARGVSVGIYAGLISRALRQMRKQVFPVKLRKLAGRWVTDLGVTILFVIVVALNLAAMWPWMVMFGGAEAFGMAMAFGPLAIGELLVGVRVAASGVRTVLAGLRGAGAVVAEAAPVAAVLMGEPPTWMVQAAYGICAAGIAWWTCSSGGRARRLAGALGFMLIADIGLSYLAMVRVGYALWTPGTSLLAGVGGVVELAANWVPEGDRGVLMGGVGSVVAAGLWAVGKKVQRKLWGWWVLDSSASESRGDEGGWREWAQQGLVVAVVLGGAMAIGGVVRCHIPAQDPVTRWGLGALETAARATRSAALIGELVGGPAGSLDPAGAVTRGLSDVLGLAADPVTRWATQAAAAMGAGVLLLALGAGVRPRVLTVWACVLVVEAVAWGAAMRAGTPLLFMLSGRSWVTAWKLAGLRVLPPELAVRSYRMMWAASDAMGGGVVALVASALIRLDRDAARTFMRKFAERVERDGGREGRALLKRVAERDERDRGRTEEVKERDAKEGREHQGGDGARGLAGVPGTGVAEVQRGSRGDARGGGRLRSPPPRRTCAMALGSPRLPPPVLSAQGRGQPAGDVKGGVAGSGGALCDRFPALRRAAPATPAAGSGTRAGGGDPGKDEGSRGTGSATGPGGVAEATKLTGGTRSAGAGSGVRGQASPAVVGARAAGGTGAAGRGGPGDRGGTAKTGGTQGMRGAPGWGDSSGGMRGKGGAAAHRDEGRGCAPSTCKGRGAQGPPDRRLAGARSPGERGGRGGSERQCEGGGSSPAAKGQMGVGGSARGGSPPQRGVGHPGAGGEPGGGGGGWRPPGRERGAGNQQKRCQRGRSREVGVMKVEEVELLLGSLAPGVSVTRESQLVEAATETGRRVFVTWIGESGRVGHYRVAARGGQGWTVYDTVREPQCTDVQGARVVTCKGQSDEEVNCGARAVWKVVQLQKGLEAGQAPRSWLEGGQGVSSWLEGGQGVGALLQWLRRGGGANVGVTVEITNMRTGRWRVVQPAGAGEERRGVILEELAREPQRAADGEWRRRQGPGCCEWIDRLVDRVALVAWCGGTVGYIGSVRCGKSQGSDREGADERQRCGGGKGEGEGAPRGDCGAGRKVGEGQVGEVGSGGVGVVGPEGGAAGGCETREETEGAQERTSGAWAGSSDTGNQGPRVPAGGVVDQHGGGRGEGGEKAGGRGTIEKSVTGGTLAACGCCGAAGKRMGGCGKENGHRCEARPGAGRCEYARRVEEERRRAERRGASGKERGGESGGAGGDPRGARAVAGRGAGAGGRGRPEPAMAGAEERVGREEGGTGGGGAAGVEGADEGRGKVGGGPGGTDRDAGRAGEEEGRVLPDAEGRGEEGRGRFGGEKRAGTAPEGVAERAGVRKGQAACGCCGAVGKREGGCGKASGHRCEAPPGTGRCEQARRAEGERKRAERREAAIRALSDEQWFAREVPRIPYVMGRERLGRAAAVLEEGLGAALAQARGGNSVEAGLAVMAACVETACEASRRRVGEAGEERKPRRGAGGRPRDGVVRAEHLVQAGQVGRAAAALGADLELERAEEDARAQLVVGLDEGETVQRQPCEAAPRVMDGDERAAWGKALAEALRRGKPRCAPGPSGLTMDLLRQIVRDKPHILGVLAELMPHLLRETPRALARARLAVLVSTKASGRRKARAIACGEALLRLMERAVMIRWGQRLHEAAEHSAAHLKDGALRAAAVIQGCVERGMVVASLDASRAFDSVAHTAVLAALKAAGLPAEFVRFVMDTLEAREYAVAGTRIVPPRGRGTAQGTALGPSLFALTCERAAAAAERAVPGALIITYLDNVYVAAWKREDVERAVKEVVEQWERDGLRRGECFAVNAQVEGLPAAGADARLLGVGLDGHAPERYARARALAQKASKLSALAELIVIRDCAVAEVVYDQRAGGDMAELRGLHEELVEQLRLRAGLPARMAGTISRPARRRGLGVRPN